MSGTLAPARRICPHCEAVTRSGAANCWLCGAAVREHWEFAEARLPAGAAAPFRPGRGRASPQAGAAAGHFQFGLSTLLLVVTLVAIICSITAMAPGIGVVAAIVALCGLIGAARRSAAAEAKGAPLTQAEKIAAFLVSAGVTFLVLLLIAVVVVVILIVGLYIACSGAKF